MVVAGADLPGPGPWQLRTQYEQMVEIVDEPVHDLSCTSGSPTDIVTWSDACEVGAEPIFDGEVDGACPPGCSHVALTERPWEGFEACYCDFDATWMEALQHCRSAGLDLTDADRSPCGGDFVFDQCGYPVDQTWARSGRLDGEDFAKSCPEGSLPAVPQSCNETYNQFEGYNDIELLDVYTRLVRSRDCLAPRAFYCELPD